MFGITVSCQTLGSDICDFGVMGSGSLWVVVLEWAHGEYSVRWQDVDICQ